MPEKRGKKEYESRTEEILTPIALEYGVEIYDVEYVKEGSEWYLRAYIDKEGGVTILDCENVSRTLSDRLDEEDFIADAYILEVSSPGLGRILKKDRHLEKSIGEAVEIRLYEAVDGSREYEGVLRSFDKETLTIGIRDEEETEEKTFFRKQISQIRLALDF